MSTDPLYRSFRILVHMFTDGGKWFLDLELLTSLRFTAEKTFAPADEVVMRRSVMHSGHRPSNCRKPVLERLARHSLFDRYMKAQLRLAGGRRKLGKNRLSSDRPREGV